MQCPFATAFNKPNKQTDIVDFCASFHALRLEQILLSDKHEPAVLAIPVDQSTNGADVKGECQSAGWHCTKGTILGCTGITHQPTQQEDLEVD
jgi:hypothetical protein